jgi:hypothetical protein
VHRSQIAIAKLAFGSLLGLVSCGGDSATSTGVEPALVTFLNLTNSTLTFSADGITDTGGGGRWCLAVSPVRPNLVISNNDVGKTVTGFSPSFRSGGKYTVFVTKNSSGAFQFATVSSEFTPSAGKQAIRFFNGTSTTAAFDIYTSDTTAPLTNLTPELRNVTPGAASAFVELTAGSHEIRGARVGTKTVYLDWGFNASAGGPNTTLWIAPTPGTDVVSSTPDCTEASTRPVS